MVVDVCNPRTWGCWQEDLEFMTNLTYIVSLRLDWATWDLILKNKTHTPKKNLVNKILNFHRQYIYWLLLKYSIFKAILGAFFYSKGYIEIAA